MITSQTKLTAVIGNPIRHSMSPVIHNPIFRDEGVDAVMLAFQHESISDLVQVIRTLPIQLTAVTIPHKQTVMPLLDEISEDARAIGAVNTIINREGKLHGYNTDITGIAASLRGVELKGKNALLIGAGGVAQPIAYHLQKSGASIYCLNRERALADALVAKFGGTVIEKDGLASIPFDLIVNATPVGSKPNVDACAIPTEIIKRGSVVFDVIYAPLETKLLREAKARGARAISGLTMFIAQALEQERLWLGRDIPDRGYTALVEKTLQAE